MTTCFVKNKQKQNKQQEHKRLHFRKKLKKVRS